MTEMATRVDEALRWLESRGSKKTRDEMLTRYGITASKAYGVPVSVIQKLAQETGRDHALAAALWKTGWYEARMATAYIDEPERVTASQMDRWARDWDNWAIVDTVCFCLFDRSPHAWGKVEQWSKRREEFIRRGAFALLACLALHDKTATDSPFLKSLKLIEKAASDERNFVKKGVSWAVRSIGGRNKALNSATLELSRRLAESEDPTARSIGKLGIRDLGSPALQRRFARRASGK
jgi:3-methyladenine DNA glycosylase AlkD